MKRKIKRVIALGTILFVGAGVVQPIQPIQAYVPKTEVTKDFLSHLNQNESEKGKEAGQFVRWSNGGGKYTLHFQDTLTDSPVISEIAKRFDISFNIRAAGIQSVQEKKIGTLVMDFDGEAAELAKVMAYLHENGVIVEEEHA